MKQKHLYIISASYPYASGEEFVLKELKELGRYFEKIVLFPLDCSGASRYLPANVELNNSLCTTPRIVKRSTYLRNLHLLFYIFLLEMLFSGKAGFILRNFRELVSSIGQCIQLSESYKRETERLGIPRGQVVHYSIWMDDGALAMGILKWKKVIPKFVFRLHGYDLFDERRKGNYMPFRYFNFKMAERVFILSQTGYDYLLPKNVFPGKLVVNYSGIYDNGINPFDPAAPFTVVSCSNVLPIKRVDQVVEVLKHIPFSVKWVHFGYGPSFNALKEKVKELPVNIHAELRGAVPNKEILDFYREASVNLFIHLSETEGLGMAIVEAQSFGIPAIAADAGGVKEVISNETGRLVPLYFDPAEVARSMIEFSTIANDSGYRAGVRKAWKEKFDAEKNYHEFYKMLVD